MTKKQDVESFYDVIEDEEEEKKEKKPINVNVDKAAQKESDFEILSSVDPNDEFLQGSKSVSLIESLMDDNKSVLS